jgi:hypothetical protein
MPNLSRSIIDSLQPPGHLWDVEENGDYDKFLEANSENKEQIRIYLSKLSELRNAKQTPLLEDLERDYGIYPDYRFTEDERRERLEVVKTSVSSTGSWEFLQDKLREFDFDLYVHPNDPAVDPAIFLLQQFQMVCGGDNAYAGRADTFCGFFGGELVVNGDIFKQQALYAMSCGSDTAYAGRSDAVAGYFLEIEQKPYQYEVPTDPGYWPLIFFVAGPATRDPVTKELIDIENGIVETFRKEELIRLIVQYKPLHSWCGLLISLS